MPQTVNSTVRTLPSLPAGIIARRAVDIADRAVWEGLGVEPRRVLGVGVEPQADGGLVASSSLSLWADEADGRARRVGADEDVLAAGDFMRAVDDASRRSLWPLLAARAMLSTPR